MTQVEALLLSILVEAVVAGLLVGGLRWGSTARGAFSGAIATLLTHWAAWWACQALIPQTGYGLAVLLVEAAVIGAEAPAYYFIVPLQVRRAVLASAIANASSTLVGLALYALDLA